MARKLAKNVYVGETLYMAGSTPPKEDADRITNPAAWGEDVDDAPAPAAEEPDSSESKPAAKKTAAKKSAAKKS